MSKNNEEVTLSGERLTELEAEVRHINKDVGEIKGELSDIRAINTNVAESLARLTIIAEQNQKLEPKLDDFRTQVKHDLDGIGERIGKNESFIYKAVGALAAISALAPFVWPILKDAISS